MPNIYNIDRDLIEKFRQSLSGDQVITEIGNKRKQYQLVDAKIANEISDSFDSDKLLVKVVQLRVKDPVTSWVPTDLLVKRYEGFTGDQINILHDINLIVDKVNRQLEEEKQRKEQERQEQLAKARELRIEKAKAEALAREIEKQNKREREEKALENYKLAGKLVNEYGTKKHINIYNKLTPSDELAILALIDELLEIKKEKEERLAKKEESLVPETIDLLDEDDRKVPITQWLTLYEKARDGEFRNPHESRALIINNTIFCNAARALIVNEVGSIDKETGEYSGKEGNRLYAVCGTDDDYQGLFSRYATAQEINAFVTRIYGDEWVAMIRE